MTITIKNRDGEELYTSTAADLRAAVVEAVGKKVNLTRADLARANLVCANLAGANLAGANLAGANLGGANLVCANLVCADLAGANLGGANLVCANLVCANLAGANLGGANLVCANLTRADLTGANLTGADLAGANLEHTVLDPDAQIPPVSDEELATEGLVADGDDVIGWRTKRSQHCGSNAYEVGREYTAPWFSVDDKTDCHFGLYLAGKAHLRRAYPNTETMRVRCKRCELLHAGDKWRCRRFVVEENE